MFEQKRHKIMYQQHRCRLSQAKSVIDDTPPKICKETLTKIYSYKDDATQYNRVMMENKDILLIINKIMRTNGDMDTFRNIKLFRNSRLQNAINMARKIQAQNCLIGHRILHTENQTETHRPLTAKDKERIKKTEEFDLPEEILRKYKNLRLPGNMRMKHLLLRPNIYFEMSIAGIWPLGRVVIELYTEACPQVVLEFVRFCIDQDKNRLKFVHLYPKLWLEGELQLDEPSLHTTQIEYDMRAIDHGQPGSVLSFSSDYLNGFQDGYINFSMSFKPLSVLNGRRVGFGRVRQGNKLMTSLKDFGNNVGKARKEIVLSSCGVL